MYIVSTKNVFSNENYISTCHILRITTIEEFHPLKNEEKKEKLTNKQGIKLMKKFNTELEMALTSL